MLIPGLKQPWVRMECYQTLKALGLCGINPFRVKENSGHANPRVEATLG